MQAARSPLPDSPASPDPSRSPDRFVSRSEQDVGASNYNPRDNNQDNHPQGNGRAEEDRDQERNVEEDPYRENSPLNRPNDNDLVSRGELNRIIESVLANQGASNIPPAVEIPTFGNQVANESKVTQDVLK